MNSEELAMSLVRSNYHAAAIHGDKTQPERAKIYFAFKNKNLPILVATDIAARGLDIAHVKTVVNYDIARNIESHIHRIGRTGRAGVEGTAFTLLTMQEANFAALLVHNMTKSNQYIPPELDSLARKSPRYKQLKFGRGGRGKGGKGG
eukprot:CAMPEP_0168517686 /NCGR_PEP_ID=MMETSP0405-20121227/6211_1 /TAXON_ID=498012 /ORGANISM="Trichosphaerium sp, Strain Am-I-7 wt" /LENGTH=147 /DNA_ID=CAMNT_0008537767 /DNA_START=78 /DNA_END=517 /DNA_ORIENTATION=-